MPLPFNKNLDLKLIKCVESHPLLYNAHEQKYMDFDSREVAWQQIGDKIKRPAKMCKLRWINIRDMMRRKIRDRMRNPDQRSYKYKYESELGFMIPYFKDYFVDQEQYINPSDYESYTNDNIDCEGVQNFDSDDAEESKDIKPSISKSRKKKSLDFELSGSDIIKEPSVSEVGSHELNPTDPLDVFLMTIGTTLRSFSPYYLNQAKSKIFTVVQEYELQQIVDKNGDASVSNAGNSSI